MPPQNIACRPANMRGIAAGETDYLRWLYPGASGEPRIFFGLVWARFVVLAGICRGKKIPFSGKLLWPLATIIVYSGLTSLCFFVAGKPFPHYGTLMIPPLALRVDRFDLFRWQNVDGLGLGGGGESEFLTLADWFCGAGDRVAVVSRAVWIGESMTKGVLRRRSRFYVEHTGSFSQQAGRYPLRLGLMAECYVRTDLPPATRDAIGHYVVSEGPLKQYYRDRHLRGSQAQQARYFH